MSYYQNTLGRWLWMPEPSLEPPEYSGPRYCDKCERPLGNDEPSPLCWVCAREEEEAT